MYIWAICICCMFMPLAIGCAPVTGENVRMPPGCGPAIICADVGAANPASEAARIAAVNRWPLGMDRSKHCINPVQTAGYRRNFKSIYPAYFTQVPDSPHCYDGFGAGPNLAAEGQSSAAANGRYFSLRFSWPSWSLMNERISSPKASSRSHCSM